MMQLFCERSRCCGCAACMNVCPQNAITMVRDDEGFLYPKIDQNKCVECGACRNVCAFGTEPGLYGYPTAVLAVKHKSEPVRAVSSSGGVFTAMYKSVIAAGGTVYGVSFDGKFNAVFGRAADEKGCEAFRGSKYVQSDVNDTYIKIKKDLADGRNVLFTGTPCQAAALKRYLGNVNTERLVVCDIVCHGVPSPRIWQDYLKFAGGKHGVKAVSFREKEHSGWRSSQLKIENNNGDILLEGHDENAFMKMFFDLYILRPSCYECPYASIKRAGDISIGDFWGIERSMPELDDDKGISLVLINTEKGLSFFERIEDSVETRKSDAEKCLQPSLIKPAQKPSSREFFWTKYRKKGLKYVMKSYTPYGDRFVFSRLRKKLYYIKKKILKITE